MHCVYIFTKTALSCSTTIHYHAVQCSAVQCSAISCNSMQCSIVQFLSACVQCFFTAALWRSSIHLYLMWSDTMCEFVFLIVYSCSAICICVFVFVQCFNCSTVAERYSSVFNMVWHNVWTWLLSIRMVRRLHIVGVRAGPKPKPLHPHISSSAQRPPY